MFENIIKLVRKEKVTLFIGSGFSLEANAPSVSQLKSLILNEIDDERIKEEHREDELTDLSDFFVEEICTGSRNQLISLMQEAFKFTPTCLDDHKMLAKIPHFRKIFTTNYDTLLEDSYSSKDVCVVRNDVDCTYLDDKKTSIFKIHGDFTCPDSVIITKSDYNKFHKNIPYQTMWDIVKSEFVQKHILFIGYSLQDDNIIKLIKTISKSVGRSQKNMFLIAPNIQEGKQNQLRKMGVKYLDAFAKDFFVELNKSLLENISDDFRHKWISPDIYAKYLFNYNCSPEVSIRPTEDNKISRLNSLDGQLLNHKINFDVTPSLGEKIMHPDFEKDGVYLDNSPVPCIVLEGDDFQKSVYSVNDVALEKDFKKIIIRPAEGETSLRIRIPNKDFLELIDGKSYKINEHKYLLYFDCHIYNFSILISRNEDNTATVNLSFDFRKQYKDNNLALKWIDIPIAFFSNEEVYIDEFSEKPLNLYNTTDFKAANIEPFEKYKQYYSCLKEIEIKSGVKFKYYNEYNEQRYLDALRVLYFLKHQYMAFRCKSDGITSLLSNMSVKDIRNKFSEKDHITLVTSTEATGNIQISDKEYHIPFKNEIYNDCRIGKIVPNASGQLEVKFNTQQDKYFVLYSKKSTEEEFPNMKSIEELFKS